MSANPHPVQQYDQRLLNIENSIASTRLNMTTLHTSQETRLNFLQSIITNSEDRLAFFIKRIRQIPDELLIRSKSATDLIADKIDDYRKVMKGEKGGTADKDEMFIVTEKHAVLLNKLRKENVPLYCLLVQSADAIFPESLLNQNIPYLKCTNQRPLILSNQKLQQVFVCNFLLLNARSIPITEKLIQALKSETLVFPSDDAMSQWVSANS